MNRNAQALCVKAIAVLQKERQRRKLSKYYVAQASGLSPQMIGYIERGMRNPTLETVLRVAEAMDVKLEDIIKRARKELPRPAN
ncbi:MAG TPA: helix-turn-helix transcriptional regulator [Verrucomicrobiae bacterium]|nr:helix-turn-helix transcriptional regulator [Verrucomicrobiae bacterium]